MRYNPPPQGITLIPMLSHLANPARFMRISGVALPWLGGVSLVVLVLGLFWSLILAPPDYQQGESVRIMFIHVPSAWMALSVYLFVAVASAVTPSDRNSSQTRCAASPSRSSTATLCPCPPNS